MMARIQSGLGKTMKMTYKSHLTTFSVCMNAGSINCGLMKNVQNFWGSRLKVQCLQDPNHSNVNNLNIVRREAGRHVGKKREYLKAKIKEPEINKNKNVRDLYKSISD
jgi:hypothetical protein